ncbi:MAG: hypothetical protein RL210_1665 [Pseudomonadota bacterium]|jgi:uncharacterized membrane protein
MNAPNRSFVLWWLAATIVACLVAIYTPPFAMPDEGAHFLRATEVSKLHLSNHKGDVGVEIPCADYLVAAKQYAPIAYFQPVDGRSDVNQPSCQVKTVNSAGMYSPLPYLASAIGLSITNSAGWSVENRLKAARLLNALATSVICLLVLLPLHRWRALLSLIALLPMTIWLRSSISADALTITFCVAFLGYTIGLAEQQQAIGRRQILILCSLAMLLGSMKPAYGLLGFSALVLYPGARTSSGKIKWVALLAPGASALFVSIFWARIADPNLIYLGNGANPVEQLAFILRHPLRYVQIIGATLWQELGNLTYNGIIPSLAAARQFSVHFGVANCTLLLLAGLALTASSENPLLPRQRQILVLTALFCLAAMVSPLYLTYTPVGHERILGLQGRYFLPLALCVLFPLAFQRPRIFHLSAELRTFIGAGLPAIISGAALVLFFIRPAG